MRNLSMLLGIGCSQATPPGPGGDLVIAGGDHEAAPRTGQTERFADQGPPEVDVLFLVDPAIEGDDDLLLTASIPDLVLPFRDDRVWRIGVASLAPPALGEAPAILDLGDGEPSAFLAVAIGEILASEAGPARALDVVQAVPDFFRAGSAVSVVLVSGPTPDTSTVTPDAFATWAAELRPDGRTFAVHELAPCEGAQHAAVVTASGGAAAEWCGPDTAVSVARELVLGEWRYALGGRAVPDTMQVTIEQGGYVIGFSEVDESGTGDWSLDPAANTVSFVAYQPAPDAVVYVEYEPLVE